MRTPVACTSWPLFFSFELCKPREPGLSTRGSYFPPWDALKDCWRRYHHFWTCQGRARRLQEKPSIRSHATTRVRAESEHGQDRVGSKGGCEGGAGFSGSSLYRRHCCHRLAGTSTWPGLCTREWSCQRSPGPAAHGPTPVPSLGPPSSAAAAAAAASLAAASAPPGVGKLALLKPLQACGDPPPHPTHARP